MNDLPPAYRFALAAALTLVGTVFLYLCTGPTLGLFFGAIGLAALLVPTQVGRGLTLIGDLLCGGIVVLLIALVWAAAAWQDALTIGQWLAATVLLASVALAALGLTRLLVHCRSEPTVAATSVITLFGLWFTWPIWLSSVLLGPRGATLVDWLTPAHPLFALNGLLVHLGVWSQMPIAYRLMNLNQDVPYALPESVWAAVGLHGLIGAAAAAGSVLRPRPVLDRGAITPPR